MSSDGGALACDQCKEEVGALHYAGHSLWLCRHCFAPPDPMITSRPFEKGHENPLDKGGTTAHVRDIKARRWDPQEKRMFYYKGERSFFFPKG